MNDKYLRRAYSHLQINDDYASWLEETAGNDDAMLKLYRDLNVTEHEYDVWKDAIFGGAPVKKKILHHLWMESHHHQRRMTLST